MKKKQRKVRLIRAAIQLIFFIAAPSLFSTAFAGVKSIFLTIGGQQSVTWNSFLDITALLLITTILFGRHSAVMPVRLAHWEMLCMSLPRLSVRNALGKKEKTWISGGCVHRLQKVKYVLLAFLLLSCMTGFYSKLQGMSPWDVFSMLTTGRLPKSTYIVGTVLLILIMAGMCTQERFFCQFLCPMGAVFAIMPIIPGALFKRNRPNCAPKCTLCKKRCPAHLDIDVILHIQGNASAVTPALQSAQGKNIHTGTIIIKN